MKKSLFFGTLNSLCATSLLAGAFLLLAACGSSSESDGGGTTDPTDGDKTVTITPTAGMDLYGFIGDAAKNPIAGVVVSDGYQCVTTDAKGIYQMKRNAAAEYVYYSIPADCQVNTHSASDKTAQFYTKLSASTKRYDFELTKLASGAETNFTLIAIGDPQVSARTTDPYYTSAGIKSSSSNINRLKTETMTDIASTVSALSTSVYGISMGDDVDTGASSLQASVRSVLGSTAMVTFSVIGNHDQINSNGYDKNSVAAYQSTWGPTNYSFNRGNVHFVCMNDVIFDNPADLTSYTCGFTDAQVTWLKQDLSHVPQSDMVVLCYHIPLRNTSAYSNRDNVLALLKSFASYTLFCGHTHYNEVCHVTTTLNTYEHIHGAACGAWWKSTMNVEGSPNGYAVYTVQASKFTDWYYKSVGRQRSFQMRLCSADQAFGGDGGYFNYCSSLSLKENAGYVAANIFNADDTWKVVAYEGASTTPVEMTKAKDAADAYALGYHVGVLGRVQSNYDGSSKHTYYYKRTNPDAVVKVVATDGFGNQYTANTFVADFAEAMHY